MPTLPADLAAQRLRGRAHQRLALPALLALGALPATCCHRRAMDHRDSIRWMNRWPRTTIGAVFGAGYAQHLLYEYVHWPRPLMALLTFSAAATAGWGVDLIFTKGEKKAGEID